MHRPPESASAEISSGRFPPVDSQLNPLWDLNILDPDTSLAGRFAKSLFGWRPDPSLLMVIGYVAYLVPIGGAFLSMTRNAGVGIDRARSDKVRG